MEYRERWYSAQDGLHLYFRDYGPIKGSAVPVLCLPGLTRNSHDFSRLALILSSRRRVLCLDYRGRGKSQNDPCWRNYVPLTYINDIRHLLISLNLHRIFVIGSSMGGLLTMGMGAVMPTVLAGALINDIGPVIERHGMEKILSHLQSGLPNFDDWISATTYMRERFPELPAKSDADWRWIAEGTFQQTKNGKIEQNWDLNLIRPLLGNRSDIEVWPLFCSLRGIPLVAIRGEHSEILSANTLKAMSSEIPGLITVTVDSVGHMPNLLEPQSLEALLNALDLADNTNYR